MEKVVKIKDGKLYAVKGLIKCDDKYLILYTDQAGRQNKASQNYWDLPGGLLEEGQTENESLLREVKEETGIDSFPNSKTLGYLQSTIRKKYKGDEWIILARVYKFTFIKKPIVRLSEEHSEYAWVDQNELILRLSYKYRKEDLEKI